MPRYDYRCPKCGYFEAQAGMEKISLPCPTCGSPARRYPSVPAIIGETVGKSLPGKPMREK